MIYLASPYTHADPLIIKTRFLLVEQCTAILLSRREWIYSPIVHCHELALKNELPSDFDFWKEYNIHMLRSSSKMYILDIPGWRESKGVSGEYAFAQSAYIPVTFVTEEGVLLDGPRN